MKPSFLDFIKGRPLVSVATGLVVLIVLVVLFGAGEAREMLSSVWQTVIGAD